jgi:hypothetical protein
MLRFESELDHSKPGAYQVVMTRERRYKIIRAVIADGLTEYQCKQLIDSLNVVQHYVSSIFTIRHQSKTKLARLRNTAPRLAKLKKRVVELKKRYEN